MRACCNSVTNRRSNPFDYPVPAEKVANINGVELPQNNSMDVTIERNTFLAPAGGGEYWAHWIIKNNNFQISPAPSGKRHGVCMQGYDILFEGNIRLRVLDSESGVRKFNEKGESGWVTAPE